MYLLLPIIASLLWVSVCCAVVACARFLTWLLAIGDGDRVSHQAPIQNT